MGQITAHGNPCSSFSLSFSLLCVRRGFDKNSAFSSAVHGTTRGYAGGCSNKGAAGSAVDRTGARSGECTALLKAEFLSNPRRTHSWAA